MAGSRKLNVAVIGAGVIAPSHIEGYQNIPGVKIACLCDIVKGKASAMAGKYGISNVCTDYRKALSDPSLDCVSICTDHASHVKIACDALDAGKHVLCEKALASSFKGLDAMMAAGKRNPNLVFGGVFQHRFDKVYQYVRELVAGGAFGKVLTANLQVECLRTKEYYNADKWRGTWGEEGGSVLINQAIHFVDSLSWLMGGVDSLSGAFANLTHGDSIETEDTATASLKFKCGSLGTIAATSSSHLGWEPTLSFYGSDGTLEIRNGSVIRISFSDAKLSRKIEKDITKIKEARPNQAGKAYYGPSHPTQILDFVKAVRGQKEIFIPAESAKHAVEIVLSIYKSYHDGRWVKIRD